jgi:hypothetical protein
MFFALPTITSIRTNSYFRSPLGNKGEMRHFLFDSHVTHFVVCRLPLDSVMLVISELLPKVQELQAARHKPNPTSAIMDLLRSITLTHVLPPAPPLNPRKFIASSASACSWNILLMRLILSVVRRIHRLANLPDMGRNLRARDDTPRFVEFDKCSLILREAYTDSSTANH